MTENTTSKDSVPSPKLGRREFLKKSLVWGSAGAAGLALGQVAAIEEEHGSERKGKRVVFAPGAPDSGDLRGSTFSVEGLIYPAGTIEGGGFDLNGTNTTTLAGIGEPAPNFRFVCRLV